MKAMTATPGVLAALLACTFTPTDPNGFGSGIQLDETTSGGPDAPADSSTSTGVELGSSTAEPGTSAGETGSSGAVADFGVIPDLGPLIPPGCYGKKIDFVFVISNSGTMEFAQQRLLAAFPGFMAAIEARDIDKHIMVTTPFAGWYMSDCADCGFDCDANAAPPECGAKLDECDTTLGAAYTFPAGKKASNRRCTLAGGNRYITAEEPDVDAAFECLATVGTDGGDYNDVEAAIAALQPGLNAAGACNAGFLRSDALLVITIIRDTADWASVTNAEDQVEALLLAKHNNPDAIYFNAITTDVDVDGHLCWPDGPGIESTTHLRLLTQMLPNSSFESICAEDYVPSFDKVLSEIIDLCENFVPPQ